jgi:hypothetical protein
MPATCGSDSLPTIALKLGGDFVHTEHVAGPTVTGAVPWGLESQVFKKADSYPGVEVPRIFLPQQFIPKLLTVAWRSIFDSFPDRVQSQNVVTNVGRKHGRPA